MTSRSGRNWVVLSAIAVVLASILAFLYVRTQGNGISGYYGNIALLRQLKHLDARWELDVLRSRMGVNADYDSLVDPLTTLNDLWYQLQAGLSQQSGSEMSELARNSANYRAAVAEKTRLIEHFKSHNSVLRNSLAFLPVAAGDIHRADADAHLSASVSRALLDTLIYSASPSDDEKATVEEDLRQLSVATHSPPPRITDALDIFAAHVRTVLREQPEVNKLLDTIAAVPTAERLDKLESLLNTAQRRAEAQALVYRRVLLFFAAALALLFLYVAVGLIRSHAVINRVNRDLQSANATLEQRVQERTQELHDAQSELLATAREAGMAEIATNVLHNVGNVLNSVNISAGVIGTKLHESRSKNLADAVQMMNEHATDLAAFLTVDEKGKRLPGYLGKLVPVLEAERHGIATELESLVKGIDHIRDIVATQQSHAGNTSVAEPLEPGELLEDALRMNSGGLAGRQITVVKEWADVPAVLLDKHLLLQILINLIANALQAMATVTDRPHRLTLRIAMAGGVPLQRLRIEVQDNGEGILSEHLSRIFTHGFTTRKTGHGFGLHSCVLAARAMGGQLTARSDGAGTGATFTVDLPTTQVPLKKAVNL